MSAGHLDRHLMSDRRIQVFHAVAKHLSFTKAAEALFMSQPAVTFQIRQLEEQLDTRLFDRTPGGVTLTPAGAVALEYADRILAMSGELKTRLKEMSGRIGGQLAIGASTAYADALLPEVLVAFKAHYPAVVPRLVVANSETVQARLLERAFDIGFIEGESQHPALTNEVCCEAELEFVCGPSHPLAGEPCATPESLTRHPYVSREAGSGTRQAVDRYLQDAGISPGVLQVVMEVSSPDAVRALVAAGVGFSILSRSSVAREVRLGELRALPLGPRLMRPLSVVYPRERIHSRLINSFLGFAKERIAAAAVPGVDGASRSRERPAAAIRPTPRLEPVGGRSAVPLGPRSSR
jgi:DNA-binding transcriptional LysR family regulator